MIKPRTKVPQLELDLINDTKWKLEDQNPESYTMIVFYRGLHCPICKKYLQDLASKLDEFVDRGINVIGVSMDSEERAKKAGNDWDITSLPIGFEMKEEKAREWGLYISEGINDEEPERFSEPGVFLIKPDTTLYFSAVQTMPFARPDFEDILKAIDYVKKENYPARGEA